ncbi:flowering time control protein FCA-like [Papaver somniferum]|uniref:flowering time control protein FCA-like n=1 Tax=Papaver somniferum TaxID=3469 RepID=UPI000E700B60|nr:flowering time control protein FCA-like [Papaver somniferum]
MQALQASFQSSQKTFSQLQKRLHMMRQSGQNLSRQLDAQATKLQVTAAAVPGFSTTAATTPALSPLGGQVALPPCNWTEHSSPEGYKYYYNSATTWDCGNLVMLNHSQFRCCPARFHQGLQAHEWEWKSKSIT